MLKVSLPAMESVQKNSLILAIGPATFLTVPGEFQSNTAAAGASPLPDSWDLASVIDFGFVPSIIPSTGCLTFHRMRTKRIALFFVVLTHK
jgi:hypothetical protein